MATFSTSAKTVKIRFLSFLKDSSSLKKNGLPFWKAEKLLRHVHVVGVVGVVVVVVVVVAVVVVAAVVVVVAAVVVVVVVAGTLW